MSRTKDKTTKKISKALGASRVFPVPYSAKYVGGPLGWLEQAKQVKPAKQDSYDWSLTLQRIGEYVGNQTNELFKKMKTREVINNYKEYIDNPMVLDGLLMLFEQFIGTAFRDTFDNSETEIDMTVKSSLVRGEKFDEILHVNRYFKTYKEG